MADDDALYISSECFWDKINTIFTNHLKITAVPYKIKTSNKLCTYFISEILLRLK